MNKIQALIGGVALVTAGAASAQADWNLAQPGTSSWSSGNTTYHSNGMTSQRSGNTTYHSDGSTSTRSGNMTFHSGGTTCIHYGKRTNC